MNRKKTGLFCLLLSVIFIISACGASKDSIGNQQSEEVSSLVDDSQTEAAKQEVFVDMTNTEGKIIGTATLTQKSEGVNVAISASNLPKGTHGFHIHEKGICELPDFESAGGHFNPTDAKHGFDNPDGPHAGDLPNLEVGEDGKVEESFLAEMVTLKKGQPNSLLKKSGTSLVIHADADDNVSQPAGNAGDRIACGVIIYE